MLLIGFTPAGGGLLLIPSLGRMEGDVLELEREELDEEEDDDDDEDDDEEDGFELGINPSCFCCSPAKAWRANVRPKIKKGL